MGKDKGDGDSAGKGRTPPDGDGQPTLEAVLRRLAQMEAAVRRPAPASAFQFSGVAIGAFIVAMVLVLGISAFTVIMVQRTSDKLGSAINIQPIMAGAYAYAADRADIAANHTGMVYMAMQVTMRDKSMSARYLSNLVAVGMAFSLIVIGISLFLLGYESAYKLAVNAPPPPPADADPGAVPPPAALPAPAISSPFGFTLVASSPGLVCFAFATVLIACTVIRNYEYSLQAPQIAGGSGEPPKPKVANTGAAAFQPGMVDGALEKAEKETFQP